MIYYFGTMYFIFGLIIGSFLNCLVWRIHTGESMMNRSHCVNCKAKIAWYDNIPLLSYLVLFGKCRHCHQKISIQYPAVELSTGLLFIFAFYFSYINNYSYLFLVKYLFVISVSVIIFIYDLRWYLVLDRVLLPAILIVFGLNLFLGFSALSMLISSLIGGGFFLVQFLISRGRWVGGGDIRIGALMGVVLVSWQYILVSLFIAYTTGAIIGVSLILAKRTKFGVEIPFGVFLSPSLVICMFFAEKILNWYLSIGF